MPTLFFLTNGPWDAQVELQSANDFSYRFYYTFFQENLQKTLLKFNRAHIILNSSYSLVLRYRFFLKFKKY